MIADSPLKFSPGFYLTEPPPGALHKPIWIPYGYYGTVDHTYGFKTWLRGSGWAAAQSSVNAIETAGYIVYLYFIFAFGELDRRSPRNTRTWRARLKALTETRTVYGQVAAWAVLLAFSAYSLTFWKTVLFGLHEAFSGKILYDREKK